MMNQGKGHADHLTGPRVRLWTTRWWSESDVGKLQGDRKRGDTPGKVSATLQTLSAISHTRHIQHATVNYSTTYLQDQALSLPAVE